MIYELRSEVTTCSDRYLLFFVLGRVAAVERLHELLFSIVAVVCVSVERGGSLGSAEFARKFLVLQVPSSVLIGHICRVGARTAIFVIFILWGRLLKPSLAQPDHMIMRSGLSTQSSKLELQTETYHLR